MSTLFSSLSARSSLLILSAAFLLAACGGGGGSGADSAITPPVPTTSTGTVVILLTDAPVDELSAINLDVKIIINDIAEAGHERCEHQRQQDKRAVASPGYIVSRKHA